MRRLAAIGLTLLTFTMALPASAPAAPAKGCHPRHSRTVDATRSVRVYKIPSLRRGEGLYACAYRTRRPVRLGDPFVCDSPSGCGGTRAIAVRGRYVVTRSVLGAYPNLFEHLKVVDVVRRRSRLLHSTTEPPAAPFNFTGFLRSVALTAGGRVAFTTDEYWSGGGRRTVRLAGTSRTVVVDEGAGIDLSSLAVTGRVAYWRKDGQPRTADFVD